MEQFVIRDMREEDIKLIAEIEKISFSTPWSEMSFFNELHKPYSTSRVAVLDDSIAGYICANCIKGEGHILNLAVHPDYRRHGIAKALIGNMIEELRTKGCRFIYLEVRASNDTAKKIYGNFGFRVAAIRRGYYIAPLEDAVIMMLEI